MGIVTFAKELTKILLLVWMPLTAPLASTLCPTHQKMNTPGEVSQADSGVMSHAPMQMSDHCQHEQHQADDDALSQCDCPYCAACGVIPLAPLAQIDDTNSIPILALRPQIHRVYILLDTPPPQYL